MVHRSVDSADPARAERSPWRAQASPGPWSPGGWIQESIEWGAQLQQVPALNLPVLQRSRIPGLSRFKNPCEVTVPRYQARVLVNLRPSVLDPAGEATRSAANRLGVDGVSKLRIGKSVELELDAPDEQEARRRLELLSDRLLANPVIENWTLELQQA